MERAYGLEIPQNLEEVCHPNKMVLLVYDLQIGIMSQLPEEKGDRIKKQVLQVLQAARDGGFRIFFGRPEDIARCVRFILQQPEGVMIPRMLAIPTNQPV